MDEISKIPLEELLKTPICHLGLHLKGSRVEPYVREFLKDIKKRKLGFSPQIWVSDEWFSPEGSCGISIPFYLLHSRLIKLEKIYVGEVEGVKKTDFFKLLYHELGHAFDHAYGVMNRKLTVRYFGTPKKPYPRVYKPEWNKSEYVKHLPDDYAQAHPCEDFAETFAVCIRGRSHWEKKYRNKPVFKKLQCMEELICKYQNKKPFKKSFFIVDLVSENKMTLGRYYEKKRNYQKKFKRQGYFLM